MDKRSDGSTGIFEKEIVESESLRIPKVITGDWRVKEKRRKKSRAGR